MGKPVSQNDYQQQMKDDLKSLAEIFIGTKKRNSNLDDLIKTFLPPEPPTEQNEFLHDYVHNRRDGRNVAALYKTRCFNPNNIGAITFRSVMGTEEGDQMCKKSYPVGPDGKKLKPCCACPETKRARDACIVEKGEENCTELIEAHKACMRSLGFNI